MKKLGLLFIIPAAFIIGGCSDVLDVDSRDSFTEETVWGELALSETYLNAQYGSIEDEVSNGVSWASLTDEVYAHHEYGQFNVTHGYLSVDNYALAWNSTFRNDHWGAYYSAISNINRFLEKIVDVPAETDGDKEWKERQIGEGHFIRAYLYMMVYSLYYQPMFITRTLNMDDDFTKVEQLKGADRDKLVEFIVSECDEAASRLPATREGSELGRATKGAALAVKARTLLYAASKLFDPNYPSTDKWQRAADAQKALIDMGPDGSGEDAGTYDLPKVETSEEYRNLFTVNSNPETIFQKLFDVNASVSDNMIFYWTAPSSGSPYWYGWSCWCATQAMVDAFEKADGTDAAPYDWEGRDLRFDADIFHNGSYYRDEEIQTFIPDLNQYDQENVVPGNHSTSSWYGESWNNPPTSYGMWKFLDQKFEQFGTNSYTAPWICFRLAEFYLNYAECQIELGHNDVAETYINKIRDRVNMPDIQGADIRAEYERERSVELAFEGQRWFDLRRWMKAEEVLNQPSKGVTVYKHITDPATGAYEYRYEENVVDGQRAFKAPQMYWAPIPRYELQSATWLDAAPYSK